MNARKIIWARSLERLYMDNGVIVVNGDAGVHYNPDTGKVHRAENIKGTWIIKDKVTSCNTTSRYLRVEIPNSAGIFGKHRAEMSVHDFAMVATGKLDGLTAEQIEAMDTNHKNTIVIDNRLINLEVCSKKLNKEHIKMVSKLRRLGLWTIGSSLSAFEVSNVQNWINNNSLRVINKLGMAR
jgi:hypothetical protein